MNLPSAIVGHSGFVGQTLLRFRSFDELYNSTNSQEMAGGAYSEVYFSAAKAEKWRANSDPEGDTAHIDSLIELMSSFSANRIVLISTIDVYPSPTGVDEDSSIALSDCRQAYGRNRRRLEIAVQENFQNSTILRLPALFGNGLKKNALFDLIHGNNIHLINPDGEFQFYNMNYLFQDAVHAIQHQLSVLNLSSEPIRIGDISSEVFQRSIESNSSNHPPKYSVRSKYAGLWGQDQYLYSRESVLNDIHRFVSHGA